MLKKYKMGFDIHGLLIFLIIMIPTFIWSAVPASNDILRAESTTKVADTIGSVCQVLMIAALCILINQERSKLKFTGYIVATIVFAVLYFASWVFYYTGVTNAVVILGLTVCPCLAFLMFAIDRKNYIAVIPIIGFMVCHVIYGVLNFIV